MIELPKNIIKSTRKNPKKIVLFSKPKVGKTQALAGLKSCLLLDLEDGSNFVDAMKINIQEEAIKADVSPIKALKSVIDSIKEANAANKGFVYKYGAIDTVTSLEEMVMPLACRLYQETPMGKNWIGDDITTLPNGAGE